MSVSGRDVTIIDAKNAPPITYDNLGSGFVARSGYDGGSSSTVVNKSVVTFNSGDGHRICSQ